MGACTALVNASAVAAALGGAAQPCNRQRSQRRAGRLQAAAHTSESQQPVATAAIRAKRPQQVQPGVQHGSPATHSCGLWLFQPSNQRMHPSGDLKSCGHARVAHHLQPPAAPVGSVQLAYGQQGALLVLHVHKAKAWAGRSAGWVGQHSRQQGKGRTCRRCGGGIDGVGGYVLAQRGFNSWRLITWATRPRGCSGCGAPRSATPCYCHQAPCSLLCSHHATRRW